MTDITLNQITSGYRASKLNDNFDTIKDVINGDVLHLEGGNNVMRQDLDMNSNTLLNIVVDTTDPTSVATVGLVDDALGSLSTDQVVTLRSDVDELIENVRSAAIVDLNAADVLLTPQQSRYSLLVLSNSTVDGRTVTITDSASNPGTYFFYNTGTNTCVVAFTEIGTTYTVQPDTLTVIGYLYGQTVADLTASINASVVSLVSDAIVTNKNIQTRVIKSVTGTSALTEDESRATVLELSALSFSGATVTFNAATDLPALFCVRNTGLFNITVAGHTIAPGFFYVMGRTNDPVDVSVLFYAQEDAGDILTRNDVDAFIIAASDEFTAISTTGDGKAIFRLPYDFTVVSARASLSSATTTGTITVNIRCNGVDILSTPITIDETEKTSTTAATPFVLSTSALSGDDEIAIDLDGVGDGTAKGLKVTLIGRKQ